MHPENVLAGMGGQGFCYAVTNPMARAFFVRHATGTVLERAVDPVNLQGANYAIDTFVAIGCPHSDHHSAGFVLALNS